MWPPRSPPPTKPSRSDRQRPGETAAGERRRGRRYGADVPTPTGPDFVLTSGAQVAPTCGAVAGGPRRASGARASAAVGAMAVLVLRSRSSCCHRLSVERPPLHAPTRRHPATLPYKAVAPATPRRRESRVAARGIPHPFAQRPPAQQTRKGGPLPAGGRRPGPAGDHATCPHREQPPPSPICGRHPLGQPTQQGTQAAVNQRRIIQQPRQGCPHQETIAVLPPGQLQKPTKNTKQSYKGRLIIRHFCSPGRPSSPTTCCALSPTWPSR